MVLYSITLFLAFFSAGLPAGLYSIIWEQISEKMTVSIPYVSMLRAMIAVGAVIACILSGRGSRRRERLLDLCLSGVCIETLGVIGISLSGLFWHLLLWSFVLGSGFGTSLTLLCIVAASSLDEREVLLQFSGSAAGIFAGAWLLSGVMKMTGSWRTGCQVLGIVQILIGLTAFLIRRVLMRGKDLRRKLEERSRDIDLERDRQRRQRHPDEETLRRAEKQFMAKTAYGCASAFLCGILVICLVLWPQSYRAAETGASQEITGYGVIMVGFGMMAGRILSGTLIPKKRILRTAPVVLLAVILLLEQFLIHENVLTSRDLLIFQLAAGAAVSPVFPGLILLDDVRLDREAETGLISLLPAFFLGAFIVVTPFSQALVGAGQTGYFPLWLLAMDAGIGVCLFLSLRAEKD